MAATRQGKPGNKGSSYHHGDLKYSLIEAASVILQRDGADALSLRAIAAEVGVSHMAPYAHFKNKKELVRAVTEAGFESLATAMESSIAGAAADASEELILDYGAAYLEFAIHNPELYRLMLGQVETRGRKKGVEGVERGANSQQHLASSKRPFVLLREAFALISSDPVQAKNQALGAWSLVHGISALVLEGYIQIPEGVNMKTFLASVTPQKRRNKT